MSEPAPAGPVYLDASALVKLFVPEIGSDALNRTVRARVDLIASDLAVTELVSALARRQREGGALAAEEAQRILLGQWKMQAMIRAELTPETHRAAEHILMQAAGPLLRAGDALHLALARAANAVTIACCDQRLRAAATAVGLRLYPG